MFKVPEQYRVSKSDHSLLGTTAEDGNNGVFQIPIHRKKIAAFVVVSDGAGWDHVSVHIADIKGKISTPSWAQMNKIKDLFWGPEDVVIQLHPPKSTYINNHPHTLHLWKSHLQEIILPPPEMVGLTDYMKKKVEIEKELKKV